MEDKEELRSGWSRLINSLAGFATYRKVNETLPGSPLLPYTQSLEAVAPLYKGIGNTMPDGGFLQALKDDIAAGQMPQVSWIVSPTVPVIVLEV